MKETQEVADALRVVGTRIIEASCDGFQWRDPQDVLEDPRVVEAVAKALDNVQKVPGEIRGFNILRGWSLIRTVYRIVTEWIAATKSCKRPTA